MELVSKTGKSASTRKKKKSIRYMNQCHNSPRLEEDKRKIILYLVIGWEDPLEKEMPTHSSVLAWRVLGTGDPGGLPSRGSHRVGHD